VTQPWSNQAVSLIVIQAGGGFTGLFEYSPTPGFGNLVYSVAPQTGTDPYGNAYRAGGTSYTQSGGTFFACSVQGAQITFYSAATAAGPWSIDSGLSSDAAGDLIATVLSAQGLAAAAVTVGSGWVNTVLPGTSVGPGATLETWNTLGGGLGIANLSSTHGRYRMNPMGDVEIDIVLTATGAGGPASGTFTNSMNPAFYGPAVTRRYGLMSTTATGPGSVLIGTGGAVTVSVPAFTNGNVFGGTITMPTD
jgi:hypothetical protein